MISWSIERFDELTSTQDLARERALNGAPEGTVIVAAAQTAGRGRSGNVWQTLKGNLFFSFVLRPNVAPADIGQFSFLVAVALNRVLKRSCADVQNKWPNDILVAGKKIAGILLEREDDALIVGVGVNVVSAPEDKISIHAAGGQDQSADSVLEGFLSALDDVFSLYADKGFAPLRQEWLDSAAGIGRAITVRLPSASINGVFEGLEAGGALRLRLESGEIKVIHSGEVFFG